MLVYKSMEYILKETNDRSIILENFKLMRNSFRFSFNFRAIPSFGECDKQVKPSFPASIVLRYYRYREY